MAYRKTAAVKAHLKDRRETLIDAATAAVAKHGRDRLLARTVERSGLSMGTIYQYFADVDELWAAVVASALARDVAVIADSRDLGGAVEGFYATLDKPRLARALGDIAAYRKGIRTALEGHLARMDFPPRARELTASAILGALYGLSDIDATAKQAARFAVRVAEREMA